MANQSFISIAFYPHKIQILKLNSSKNSVQKKGTFPIPDGIIDNYQVKDKVALAKVFQDAWGKMGFGEKTVGITVPEFSTFSKLLTVPKLSSKELDEAVRWRSQEFLPQEGADMVMDWQIIEEVGEDIKILAVAIHKDVLAGYIGVIGEAGLLPLVVETPSISLVRVSDSSGIGKLVIYFGDRENILIVSQGSAIAGSTVAGSGDKNYTLDTANRIINHYQEVKVEKVVVGGYVDDQTIASLKAGINKEVEFINLNFSGITPEEQAEYLIPISLQLKDTVTPESDRTINLLPPMWIKHYKDKLTDIRVWTVSLITSIVVWTIFIAVVGVFVFLNIQKVNLEKEVEGGNSTLVQEVTKEVGQVNTTVNNVLNITEKIVYPEPIINGVENIKPFGITINTYTVVPIEGRITATGTAIDRNSLIVFRNVLEESSDFTAPNLPISSLAQESNIPFELTFTYKNAPKTNQNTPIKLNI